MERMIKISKEYQDD